MEREITLKLLKVFIILIAAGFMMNGVASAGGITNDSKTPVNVSLPGIGKKKAETIIAYREKNGKFSEIEDIVLK